MFNPTCTCTVYILFRSRIIDRQMWIGMAKILTKHHKWRSTCFFLMAHAENVSLVVWACLMCLFLPMLLDKKPDVGQHIPSLHG